MILLHSIAPAKPTSNYNTPEEIAASTGPLSFDGVYRNVYEHRHLLKGRGGILFVIGSVVGKDNSFDKGQPPEEFCNWDELDELAQIMGAEIGWHTSTHPDLTQIVNEWSIQEEVTPPVKMKHFAYPYGRFNDVVIEAVKAAGFEQAWTAGRGDDSAYQRRRWHI